MPRLPGEHSLDHQIVRQMDDAWELVASRCPRCSDVHYPPRELCVNDLEKTEEIALSSGGVIYEAVRIDVAPVGFEAPYWVAYVDMPEGVRVFAPLKWDRDDEPPSSGQTVAYRIEPVRQDPHEVLGPVFYAVD